MTTQEQSNEFPKRVMLVIHSMRGGGSERQMSYLANELAASSETILVTLDPIGNDGYPLDSRIQRKGLNLVSERGGWYRGLLANISRIRALRNLIRASEPDVVVSFCDSTNILSLIATPANVPVVISERSDPRRQKLSRPWEILRTRVYPKAAICVAQTDSVGDYLASSKLISSSRLRVIPSAIRIPEIDLPTIDSSRLAQPTKTLVYVGRLSREKRVDRLLTAWSKLTVTHPSWRLTIVGDGAEREALQRLAKNLGIEASVRWALWREDVWTELAAAHAYSLVSEYEGFPQSMLEAMAAGLPVAVLDCSPAIRQAITDCVHGLVIDSETQIEPVLCRLLNNESLRMELGQNAAARALDFNWPTIAPKWLQAIQDAKR